MTIEERALILEQILDKYYFSDFNRHNFDTELLSNEEFLNLFPNIEFIGKGYTACVFKYEKYAIKVYYPLVDFPFYNMMWDYEVLTRIHNSEMSVDCIPNVYCGKSKLFVIMDYIEGEILDDMEFYQVVEESKLLELTESISQISKIHIEPKDIHPGNIVVGENQKLFLIDFGAYKVCPKDYYKPEDLVPMFVMSNVPCYNYWKTLF